MQKKVKKAKYEGIFDDPKVKKAYRKARRSFKKAGLIGTKVFFESKKMDLLRLNEFKKLVRTDMILFCKDLPASIKFVLDRYLDGTLLRTFQIPTECNLTTEESREFYGGYRQGLDCAIELIGGCETIGEGVAKIEYEIRRIPTSFKKRKQTKTSG